MSESESELPSCNDTEQLLTGCPGCFATGSSPVEVQFLCYFQLVSLGVVSTTLRTCVAFGTLSRVSKICCLL